MAATEKSAMVTSSLAHEPRDAKVERFPKVGPKFSKEAWESGEGGNKDGGERPADK